MVVRALDHVKACNTAADGQRIHRVISGPLKRGEIVELSFDGVSEVPSSFVNTAIVNLLADMDIDHIKTHLKIVNINKQIADMVRRCLDNGLRRIEAQR
jgi:hypothetical protein